MGFFIWVHFTIIPRNFRNKCYIPGCNRINCQAAHGEVDSFDFSDYVELYGAHQIFPEKEVVNEYCLYFDRYSYHDRYETLLKYLFNLFHWSGSEMIEMAIDTEIGEGYLCETIYRITNGVTYKDLISQKTDKNEYINYIKTKREKFNYVNQ
jgi:hypothetical protein